MSNIGLLGNGRHATEVASYSQQTVVFTAVQKQYMNADMIDIESPTVEQANTPVVAAVGAPGLRKMLVELWPGNSYAAVVSGSAYIDASAAIGEGSQVAPLAAVMPQVVIGNHCIVNVHASISHDCQLGDYTTISPGVHLGGNVVTGAGVFIGIGATIRDGIRIAEGAVIGAGAVLIHDATESNGVYVGNPARIIKTNKDWLHVI